MTASVSDSRQSVVLCVEAHRAASLTVLKRGDESRLERRPGGDGEPLGGEVGRQELVSFELLKSELGVICRRSADMISEEPGRREGRGGGGGGKKGTNRRWCR